MLVPLGKDTHRSLLAATLDALWIQWRALGAMTSAKHEARSMIDLEALVLCSLAFSESERRLDDVVHDWIALNSDLLSVQRIKNLAHTFSPSVTDRLGVLAAWALAEGKDARWKSLVAMSHTMATAPSTGRPVRKATKADLGEPVAVMARLRVGMGTGNKADVLTYLLGSGGRSAAVREIAAETGYSVHALHRTIDDMARAGLIQQTDQSPATYAVNTRAWSKLLGVDNFPPWGHWLEAYRFTAEFDRWMVDTRDRDVSEYAFGVQAREFLVRYDSTFRRAGVKVPRHSVVREPVTNPGNDFVLAVRRVTDWIVEHV